MRAPAGAIAQAEKGGAMARNVVARNVARSVKPRDAADRRLISLSQAYEVHYWSKKFKVTPARLRAAVRRVGHSAKTVEAYLEKLAHRARDRARIAIGQAYEVHYWSKKFDVTPTVLKAAVEAVGHSSKAVAAYLGSGAAKTRKAAGAARKAVTRKAMTRKMATSKSPARKTAARKAASRKAAPRGTATRKAKR